VRIYVAADFTAGPLQELLEYAMATAGLPVEVAFAPYGEVFQSLLDPGGALRRNSDGGNVVLLRPDVWAAAPDIADDLVRAVVDSAGATGVPHLVVVCPGAEEGPAAAFERQLADGLADDARIRVVTAGELLGRYPVASVHDPYTAATADVPYTPEFFAALAIDVTRAVYAWRVPRPKVIVVDADHTLWNGAVGEDGPSGVRVGPEHREIQRLLLAQRDAGRLLCIASRNAEADVLQVLAEHPDMVLRPEHLTAWRINWAPKPANLAELAAELDVGLDTFVFIDDNPVEVAAVRAALPQVVTPAVPDAMLAYLQHCWPLDHPRVTEDDRMRAERYRQARERETARSAAPSLTDFLATLDLVVDVAPMCDADLARVAQLTQRINQFTLTGTRRTASELAARPPETECLVVRARDRFGDYGTVGCALATVDGARLRVDGLLLSCRVLGRGVEHRVLNALGDRAAGHGVDLVSLAYRPTPRNEPAATFLRGLPAGERAGDDGATWFELNTQVARTVTYEPATAAPATPAARVEPAAGTVDNDVVDRIASTLAGAAQLLAAVAADRSAATGAWQVDGTPTETAVAAIWAELLEFPPRSVQDDFYELGGHSLLAVQFAGRVREEFGVELPVDVLFTDRFTIADMARNIDEQPAAPVGDDALLGLLDELDGLSDDEVRRRLDAGR
jgi:FkbH-like protein